MKLNQCFSQQGWTCPKCGRVNAPWMPWCDCPPSPTITTNNTGTVNYKQIEERHKELEEIALFNPWGKENK